MEHFVEFREVRKTYTMGEVTINALHDASFHIERGEVCVIVGPSGAGKTTLLNILGGMDTLSEGQVIVDGKDVPKDPVEALRLHQAIWTCGVRAALAHGGVVNDHHGVGIKLGRLMKEQYGPAMQVFEGIKKQLDPNGIMNPFKRGL